jgi:hypothetical protein
VIQTTGEQRHERNRQKGEKERKIFGLPLLDLKAGAVITLVAGFGGFLAGGGGEKMLDLIKGWGHSDTTATRLVTLTSPADGDNPTICTTITGTFHLQDGQAIAVGLRERAEARWYYDGRPIVYTPDHRWSIATQMGDRTDTESRTYDVAAIVLPRTMIEYLESTNRMQDVNHEPLTFWSSPDMPPGVIAKAQRTVTRQGKAGICP